MPKKSRKNWDYEAKKRRINPKHVQKRKVDDDFEDGDDLFIDYDHD
ncbi:hypothetical protein [Candidatus Lokiarchaeum ossiferum]